MGISRKQALDGLRSDDLIGIGMEADALRRRLHPEGVVSYAIDCAIDCAAVMGGGTREGNQPAVGCAHRLFDEIGETVERGSTGVRLVNGAGGPSSQWKDCGMAWFEGMLRGIRQRFPSLWIEGLSAAEIVALAAGSGLDLRQTIARLRDAGLDSIGSDDAHPKCSPSRFSVAEWIAVHRAAHSLGMRTIATTFFGAGETLEQSVDLLAAVRRLQEETGGFTAFIPRSLPSRNPATGGWDEPTAVEQLKTLAIARIFLDNIQNIQWSGAAQGLKVLQMGLRFGANDAGSVTPEANATNQPTEEDLRRIIRDAGFQPVQRDTPYRTMFLN
jgi:cyclic dehypoxanthinyl futalosine synthase